MTKFYSQSYILTHTYIRKVLLFIIALFIIAKKKSKYLINVKMQVKNNVFIEDYPLIAKVKLSNLLLTDTYTPGHFKVWQRKN